MFDFFKNLFNKTKHDVSSSSEKHETASESFTAQNELKKSLDTSLLTPKIKQEEPIQHITHQTSVIKTLKMQCKHKKAQFAV